MTQKECLYVEDAIGHEQTIIKVIEETCNKLEEEELIEYMNNEIKTHQKMEKELKKELEVNSHE